MPREREAWKQGLVAVEAEARRAHGMGFVALHAAEKDALEEEWMVLAETAG